MISEALKEIINLESENNIFHLNVIYGILSAKIF